MDKQELRREMAHRKKELGAEKLIEMSADVLAKLENHPDFKAAHTVLMYYSLGDEVHTHRFVERWCREKNVLLPVVVGDDLILRRYEGIESMKVGAYNILEPSGEEFTRYEEIDLVVVPGVAFDRKGHRLGRGKGYYDRLLPRTNCPRVGICFLFQLLEEVPAESFDVPMDDVVFG